MQKRKSRSTQGNVCLWRPNSRISPSPSCQYCVLPDDGRQLESGVAGTKCCARHEWTCRTRSSQSQERRKQRLVTERSGVSELGGWV
ncbi:hypothetical protein MPTK1_3g14070 [Marchantia polymorpha subsp. ruderalis]|uniref:Uncharacterized protein n=2 Tax=Marchantia polymorpha TaxID=3197 RepID=A0AAF6B0L3_MARPO|nr:hypothetical protein MARPO_0004s0264 [Marchantia polymorpha]BBN05547.1 hypothetical protein Mp_3g14070 [Marchantia polymorpha subsp. ruderalis]|eukprot:PTQ49037.1 hypothetical protein MARPO_0004s0264 [Marchantia polymorpha]